MAQPLGVEAGAVGHDLGERALRVLEGIRRQRAQRLELADRRQGAEAVVRRLVESGAVGLVTTHDLALTGIAERLAPRAANVHFEDRFEGGAITFDYLMRPGVVQSTNGLALMRAVGIDV